MDILKLFTNNEPTAGLEINDSYLKLVLLEQQKNKQPRIKTLIKQPLEAGIILGGKIINQPKLLESFKALAEKSSVKYAVVSLPADYIYAKIHTFPDGISIEKTKESIDLLIDYQLPQKKETGYFDWKINKNQTNKILISFVNKSIVNDLVTVLSKAGIKTVALEYHSLGVARILNQKTDESLLFVEKGVENFSFSVIKNNSLYLLYSLPNKINLTAEIKKIIKFCEFEIGLVSTLGLFGEFTQKELTGLPMKPTVIKLPELLKDQTKLEAENQWLVAIGTALRGLIERSNDKETSLLEVGTEDAYKQQKALAFANFLTRTTVAIAIFFTLIMGGFWLLMINIQQNSIKQIENYKSTQLTVDAGTLEAKAQDFNQLINQSNKLIDTEPQWSILIRELTDRITPGITINNLSMPLIDQPITMSGVAKKRNDINIFKQSLNNSTLIKDVVLPLENLGKKEDIPFSVNFYLTDTSSLILK